MEKQCDLEKRLDDIEEILKLLLINSVVDHEYVIEQDMKNRACRLLEDLKLTEIRVNYIEGIPYLFIGIDETETLKSIKSYYFEVKERIQDIRIVFSFERMHSKRKKALCEAKVSYFVRDGEMHIY